MALRENYSSKQKLQVKDNVSKYDLYLKYNQDQLFTVLE